MIAHHFGEDVKFSEFHDLSPLKQTAGALPLDLHVLGTPPAFILSQDQTLQKR